MRKFNIGVFASSLIHAQDDYSHRCRLPQTHHSMRDYSRKGIAIKRVSEEIRRVAIIKMKG